MKTSSEKIYVILVFFSIFWNASDLFFKTNKFSTKFLLNDLQNSVKDLALFFVVLFFLCLFFVTPFSTDYTNICRGKHKFSFQVLFISSKTTQPNLRFIVQMKKRNVRESMHNF